MNAAWEAEQRAKCAAKRSYYSERTASNAAWLWQIVHGGQRQTVYRCKHCPDFHLTSR